MAKDKKAKVQQAKETVDKQQKESELENDITKLNEIGKGGSGSGSTSGGNSGNSGNGKGGTGGKNPTGGNGGSTPVTNTPPKSTDVKKKANEAINDYVNYMNENDKIINGYNTEKANKYDVDTTNGNSEYYTSLRSLWKERQDAKEKRDNAVDNNKIVSENRSLKKTYDDALKANDKVKKEVKKQDKAFGKRLKALEKEQKNLEKAKPAYRSDLIGEALRKAQSDATNSEVALQEFQKSKEWIDNVGDPTLQKKMKDLAEAQSRETQKRDELLEQFKTAEEFEQNWDNIQGQINDIKEQQKQLTSGNIDAFMEWAEQNGNDDDKAKAKILQGFRDTILKADEDGTITDEEKQTLLDKMETCEKLIEQEKKTNSELVDAEKTFDNARNKFMYYLFDQIKAFSVLMVGLSAGNASMVYSALDNFNKQIADSEAGYRTSVIKAFANNTYKNITGDSDAQYAMKQLLPELKKNQVFMELNSQQQAYVVKGLEDAFEEYQSYISKGGKNDVAAWYAAQQANGNNSEWVKLITTLISIGALNSNSIKDFFEKYFSSGDGNSKPTNNNTGSKKPVSLINGKRLDMGGLYNNALSKGVPAPEPQEDTDAMIRATRDKQNVVNGAVAAHLPQAGTQGSPLAMTNNRGQAKAV